MSVSQIVEATNFTQSRVDFNIPARPCSGMKLCHVGVYGAATTPLDPILGQLLVVQKITLRDGGVILSQYDRNIESVMKLKLLSQNSNDDMRNARRNVDASRPGVMLRRGGEVGTNAYNASATEGVVLPKICQEKKDYSRIAVAEAETRFAILDLADVLGWCNAVYTAGESQVLNTMPCHLHKQLKLSIEFAAPATVALNATTVAQPYLIFHEDNNPQLMSFFSSQNLTCTYADWELEQVYMGNSTSSRVFLNSFYNKTVSRLAMLPLMNGAAGQPVAFPNEVFRILVNNIPYFQLTTGINTPAKKGAFTRLSGVELAIPLHSDKPVASVTNSYADNSDNTVTAIVEGETVDVTASNWYRAANSWLVLRVGQKINNMQLDYSLGTAPANPLTLQFWGQCEKQLQYTSSAPIVSYL